MEENKEVEKNIDLNWFSKHAETIAVISVLFGGFLWMDGKFEKITDRLSTVEKDVAVIKTVLSMKGVNCSELAMKEKEKQSNVK